MVVGKPDVFAGVDARGAVFALRTSVQMFCGGVDDARDRFVSGGTVGEEAPAVFGAGTVTAVTKALFTTGPRNSGFGCQSRLNWNIGFSKTSPKPADYLRAHSRAAGSFT